jgi:hypothetical protein
MKRGRVLDPIVAAAIFLVVFVIHFASGLSFASDSKWTIHTALSIIREGNTDLDEYRALIERYDEFGAVETFGGHVYTNFPIGPSLIAVPFVFAIDQLARSVWSFDLQAYVSQTIPIDIERFVASIVVALTAVVMYRIGRLYLNRSRALFLVFVFACGTSAWSTASRALWQHGPSMLMLALALYILLLARQTPHLSQFAALPLALSYVMRPSNSLAIVLLTWFVFVQYRSYFVRYMLWAAVIAAPFVAYNGSIYQSPLSPYYTLYRSSDAATFFEALLGTLFSPSRGLFIFSPILLLAVVSVIQAIRRRSLERLDVFIVASLALHWLITSLWPIWWGGWSFGPRLFADTLPYWMYLMIPAIAELPGLNQPRNSMRTVIALALAGLSFFIHYRGANAEEVLLEWSAYPANVDTHPDRVWDWRDVQFLRGIPWGTPIDLSISGVPLKQLDWSVYGVIGTNTLRARRFDASTALIAAPGTAWLILADDQPVAEAFEPLLANIDPRATGRTLETGIAYRLYRFDLGERIREAARRAEQVALWSPDLYPDPAQTHDAALPAHFGETADLIGFQIIAAPQPGRLSILTYWQARDSIVAPLRIFVHAIGRDGQLVAQDDRLDAPSRDWRPGDLIAQVADLDIPATFGPIGIEVGLYNPDTGERLPLTIDGQAVDTRVLLRLIGGR